MLACFRTLSTYMQLSVCVCVCVCACACACTRAFSARMCACVCIIHSFLNLNLLFISQAAMQQSDQEASAAGVFTFRLMSYNLLADHLVCAI